jgi:Heparinase II/III N-terminus
MVKPRVWKYAIRKRTISRPASDFPTIPSALFFNAEQHFALCEMVRKNMGEEEIFRQAEEARNHRFAFFSNSLREYGEVINWHKDYASAKEWDATKPASELDFLTSTNASDVKYAWELNRCHWFSWLGIAYLLDSAEGLQRKTDWAQAFKRDVESWQAANPLGMGINWAMPMEVAIRATNWMFAASFFHDASELDGAFWQGFMRTLWQHGRFLEYNLEYVRHNANHFMSNAMGLVVLGAYFHDTENLSNDSKRWFLKGKAFMEKEILRQFYLDGVNYEKSTSYHRFVVEMCTIAFAAAERIDSPFQVQHYERLSRANSYIFAYSRADGSAPRIGDTDNGRVLRYFTSEDFNNHLKNKEHQYWSHLVTMTQREINHSPP